MVQGDFALFDGVEMGCGGLKQRFAAVQMVLGRECDFANGCGVCFDELVAGVLKDKCADFGLVVGMGYSVCKSQTPPSLFFNAFRTAVIFRIFVAWSSFSRRSLLKKGLREFKKVVFVLSD